MAWLSCLAFGDLGSGFRVRGKGDKRWGHDIPAAFVDLRVKDLR